MEHTLKAETVMNISAPVGVEIAEGDEMTGLDRKAGNCAIVCRRSAHCRRHRSSTAISGD